MNIKSVYLSIRWKIIILASLVLGLTSALFIWQQHKLQLREFELGQAEFRERSHAIVNHLFQSQAERMQMLGELFVAQPTVREDMLGKRRDRLARSVEAFAAELSLGQGLLSVVLHDAGQQSLASWGDPDYSVQLVPLARMAAIGEQPQSHVLCKQFCVYQTVMPVNYLGHTIGTISLTSNLEYILDGLHQLADADVAVLNGKVQNGHAPLDGVRIVSSSGGAAIRDVLEAARNGDWLNGRLQLNHAGQVYQVNLVSASMNGDDQISFAIVSDVTSIVQDIDLNVKNNLLRGLELLGLAVLLLYVMLRPTMGRIYHVSHMLPLLGEEKFAQVRLDYASRPGWKRLDGLWMDEVDELEGLALELAGRLEKLQSESNLHTDLLAAQADQLKQEWNFISGLLDTAPVLILNHGGDGRIQLANVCAAQSCGLTTAELVGRGCAELFLGISQQEYDLEMSKMQAGVVRRMESRVSKPEGGSIDVLWFNSLLDIGGAAAQSYLLVGMDITEHKKNEARIHNLAFYDPLTKLPNRRMLTDCIKHAIAASSRKRNHCALVFIDLDHFKAINDSKGNEVGDQLIAEIAKRLRGNVHEYDTVAHLGGDEFVVLIEELDEEVGQAAAQVRLIVERLRLVISRPCMLQGAAYQVYTFHITSSMGISLFSGHELSVDDLLRHANMAMSHAKTAGRNTLRFFDTQMQTGLEVRAAMEADLRLALPHNQFQLFYQIQINSAGRAVGAEALLRWFHPERGMVSPMHFIPLAEETLLILPVGLWVMETACAQIKAWEADTLTAELQLAVNVSARQFHQPEFVEQVLSALARSGANPARLKLELTESLVLNDITDAITKMHQLKKHGVRFSIDDFGTAYSSLSYLTQLPLDQLKIDQSFVRNIGVKPSDAIVVQTIINMANNLGMEVIAEGVETHAQREFLEAAGCLVYQGYLYSKPVALDAFTAYLKASWA